jgi:hypothetical protein
VSRVCVNKDLARVSGFVNEGLRDLARVSGLNEGASLSDTSVCPCAQLCCAIASIRVAVLVWCISDKESDMPCYAHVNTSCHSLLCSCDS